MSEYIYPYTITERTCSINTEKSIKRYRGKNKRRNLLEDMQDPEFRKDPKIYLTCGFGVMTPEQLRIHYPPAVNLDIFGSYMHLKYDKAKKEWYVVEDEKF